MNPENQKLTLYAWAGFAALINAYAKENVDTPLKVTIDGRDCPVLSINNDFTAKVELATGEKVVPLTPEHVQVLYREIGRHFDLRIPSEAFAATKGEAMAAGIGGEGTTTT